MAKKVLGVLGAAAATLLAGQASAGALGAPNEIFIGGATAVQETFQLDILIRFCNYDGNADDTDGVITPAVFVNALAQASGQPVLPGGGNGSAALPSLRHTTHGVVYCDFKPTLPGDLAGARTAVYKFNGGSGTGVAPVANPAGSSANEQRYMDASPATCTQVIPTSNPGPGNTFLTVDNATRFRLYTCPGAPILTQAPDGGISDVEPKMFVGELANGFGQEVPGVTQIPQNDFVDQGNLIVKAGPGIVFGVGVTLNLYDQLVDAQRAAGFLPGCPANPTRAQRDTLACMPSIPTSLVTSIFSGDINQWNVRPPYGLAIDSTGIQQANRVNICRRTAGSGTHAQFSAHFLRTNCINNSPTMPTFRNNVTLGSLSQVYENTGSGQLEACLGALNDGNGFNGGGFTGGLVPPAIPTGPGNSSIVPVGRTALGIGYNSLERNSALSQLWRFVKVDFAAPTLENAFYGIYDDIYYLSYQNRITGTDTPQPLAGGIRTVPADATEINVHREFFALWNSPSPASVDAVNRGLIVNPDGIAGNGDEWQGGLLSPSTAAPQVFAGGPTGTDARTPWARQTFAGTADSCQELRLFK